jgi:hypothetical protein
MGKAHGISGGGLEGRQTAHYQDAKIEPRVNNIDPRRPSQIGMSVHYVKTDLYQSSTSPKGPNPVVGSECKPGGGRSILPHGTQARSVTRPMPKGRDLFK